MTKGTTKAKRQLSKSPRTKQDDAPAGVGSSGEVITKRLSHGVKFYCAALDQQVKLAHENPSIGLVLCKTADSAQVRPALTAAAKKIGVATYQTALPDEGLLRERLRRLPIPKEPLE